MVTLFLKFGHLRCGGSLKRVWSPFRSYLPNSKIKMADMRPRCYNGSAIGTIKKNTLKPLEWLHHPQDCSFALIILNQPIPDRLQKVLKHLWKYAALRVLTDGGGNHWHSTTVAAAASGDTPIRQGSTSNSTRQPLGSASSHTRQQDHGSQMNNTSGENSKHSNVVYDGELDSNCETEEETEKNSQENRATDPYLPDLLCGDFDSIHPKVLDYYRSKGCEIVHTPDQNETDFTKCIRCVADIMHERKIQQVSHVVCVCGTLGGDEARMDHVLANINTLHKAERLHLLAPPAKVYLLTEQSLSTCLTQGSVNLIHCPPQPYPVGERRTTNPSQWCSLVPLAGPCHHCTTEGLKWNLHNEPLIFGERISTSNEMESEQVVVTCSDPLLWSMRLTLPTH